MDVAGVTTVVGVILLAAPGLTGLPDTTGRAIGATVIAAGLWGVWVMSVGVLSPSSTSRRGECHATPVEKS